MKDAIQLLLVLFLLYAVIGCAPVYVPTAHNTPMFSAKNEFQASAGIGSGLNLQTAYSISNHLGIIANCLFADSRFVNRLIDGDQWRIHKAGEVGLGYYTNFNKNWHADIFTGVGFGKGHASDTARYVFLFKDYYETKGTYSKIYLQPSIGIKKGSFIGNLSFKFSYVDFTDIQIKVNGDPIHLKEHTRIFLGVAGHGVVSIWRKKLFASAQVSFNYPTNKANLTFLNYEPIIVSVGLMIKLKPKPKEL